MKHRPLRLTAALAVAALGLTACGGGSGSESSSSAAEGSSAAGSSAASGGGDSYSIALYQWVSHPSLDAAAEGFKSAFEEAGVEVEWDEQNPQGDAATGTSIASGFASADVDLVAPIATPAAQGVANAVADKPVVFMAVTDPVGAELVESLEKPGGNVTGVSDQNPVEEQLQLVKDVDAEAKTVGIVWNSGESNSKAQVDQAKEAAANLGLEIKDTTITNSSEVAQGVQALGDVDAIYVPTDNAVVSSLETVIQYGQEKQIPVIAAESDSVERGALGTVGIDYEQHGKRAGELALQILKDGGDPAELPVEMYQEEDLRMVLNQEAADAFGVELPESLTSEADEVIGG